MGTTIESNFGWSTSAPLVAPCNKHLLTQVSNLPSQNRRSHHVHAAMCAPLHRTRSLSSAFVEQPVISCCGYSPVSLRTPIPPSILAGIRIPSPSKPILRCFAAFLAKKSGWGHANAHGEEKSGAQGRPGQLRPKCFVVGVHNALLHNSLRPETPGKPFTHRLLALCRQSQGVTCGGVMPSSASVALHLQHAVRNLQ